MTPPTPTPPTPPTLPTPVCVTPGCDKPAAARNATGRPPIYCGPRCRPTAGRQRSAAIVVEIAHTPAQSRPVGPVWTVTLRRGQRSVTVADLGRFGAEDLAQRIADIVGVDTITRPPAAGTPS